MSWRVYVRGEETGGKFEPWGRFDDIVEANEFARSLWYGNEADREVGSYDPYFEVHVREEI